jgi:3-phosphoshikimate 1-carboxyvinyltransferase
MIVNGGSEITGAAVHSHNDHRIAMACAVVALRANGNVIINEANCVEKSYPGFFNDLISIGASIQFQ